jgi:hypothetical protein
MLSPVNQCKTLAVSGNANRLHRSFNCTAGGVSIEYVAMSMLPAQTLQALGSAASEYIGKKYRHLSIACLFCQCQANCHKKMTIHIYN